MEPESSLPHSQQPATHPYPQPHHLNRCPPLPTSWIFILILSSNLHPGLPSGLLPPGFPTKILYAPLSSSTRATCPAHLTRLNDYPNNIWWGLQIVTLLETWVLLATLVCILNKISLTLILELFRITWIQIKRKTSSDPVTGPVWPRGWVEV